MSLTIGYYLPGIYYVWLNRCLVGRYDYGVYTPFSFDLTGRLIRAGEKNELTIALDNTKGYQPDIFTGLSTERLAAYWTRSPCT